MKNNNTRRERSYWAKRTLGRLFDNLDCDDVLDLDAIRDAIAEMGMPPFLGKDNSRIEVSRVLQFVDVERKKSLKAGFVYIVKCEGFYKIGRTKLLNARLSNLRGNSPLPLQLVHKIKSSDMAWAEAELHSRYQEKRVRGEWFALSREDLAEIKKVKKLEPVSAAA